MKKVFVLLIVSLMTVFIFCSCGSGGTAGSLLQVGDTAEGEVCSVTVNSVEYVDKIENGLKLSMWSPTTMTNYQDVAAEEGYSIVKISYHIDYKGKENGRFTLGFEIDYDDGYTFDTGVHHVVPKAESGVGFEKTYDFLTDNSFEVDDPLNYKGEDAVAYIIVNDVALTDTEKPLVMRVGIPIAPDTLEPSASGNQVYTQSDTETFTYDLRTIEFDITSQAADGDQAMEEVYQNALQLMDQNTWGRYGDAGELLATILDYKDSKELFLQCYVKGHMNWPEGLPQDFEDVSEEELSSSIIGTWQANGSNDPYVFSEDGTVQGGRNGNWHIEDGLLVIGDYAYSVKKPYEGSLILYFEVTPIESNKGLVADRLWKE